MKKQKILVYGYGNIGRQDDGAGIFLVQILEKWVTENKIKKVFFNSDYQLNIEDSLLIAGMDKVLFIDASKTGKNCSLKPITGEETISSFSTHFETPETLVKLARELYNKSPKTFLLTIRGYKWNFNEEMTSKAKGNLNSAIEIAKNFIQS